jgi:hypothetical protein
MTDQHVPYKAHPAHWEFVIKRTQGLGDDYLASVLRELMERIEALEAAQLEQAEVRALSWGIVRRVEALELARMPIGARSISSKPESRPPTAAATRSASLRSC